MNLPLTSSASESFSITILENLYQIKQRWNTIGFWSLDFADADGVPIVYGVRIVTQTKLLEQYPTLPFDLLSEKANDPTRDNLVDFELAVIEK